MPPSSIIPLPIGSGIILIASAIKVIKTADILNSIFFFPISSFAISKSQILVKPNAKVKNILSLIPPSFQIANDNSFPICINTADIQSLIQYFFFDPV